MRPIRLYWWQGEGAHDSGKRNFGDFLSPLMVSMASGRAVEYAPVAKADMLAIGTILKKERKSGGLLFPRKLHIWGSGAGNSDERFSSRHYYHAVRGTLTRQCIDGQVDEDTALGDPGLLVSRYWEGKPRPPKRFTLGVIPHFIDMGSPIIDTLLQIRGAKLISVFSPIDEILRDITACHYVVSSSLHGLIVSDALGVPNRRLIVSNNVKSTLKYADYYSALGLAEPPPIDGEQYRGIEQAEKLIGDYEKRDVERVCNNLLKAFPNL